MSAIDDLLARYEQEKSGEKPKTEGTTSSTKLSGADKLKKMYTPQGEEEIFRAFIPKDQDGHYEVAHFHEVKLFGKYKKLYCPKHNDGKPCPMCEESDRIRQETFDKFKKGDQGMKDGMSAARVFEAKKFYMIKGVDRQRLADGLKFWRVKYAFANDGDFDTLMTLAGKYKRKKGEDFADPIKGFDIEITVGVKKLPNGKEYKGITLMGEGDKVALATDKAGEPDLAKIDEILSDTTTWREVFTPFSITGYMNEYEYLKAVMEDRAPRWDEGKKRFVVKGADGQEEVIDLRPPNGGGSTAAATPVAPPVKITKESLQEATELDMDNDLPF